MGNKKEQTPASQVYEAAVIFARMWGVMETLEPLPNLGNEKVKDIAVKTADTRTTPLSLRQRRRNSKRICREFAAIRNDN